VGSVNSCFKQLFKGPSDPQVRCWPSVQVVGQRLAQMECRLFHVPSSPSKWKYGIVKNTRLIPWFRAILSYSSPVLAIFIFTIILHSTVRIPGTGFEAPASLLSGYICMSWDRNLGYCVGWASIFRWERRCGSCHIDSSWVLKDRWVRFFVSILFRF